MIPVCQHCKSPRVHRHSGKTKSGWPIQCCTCGGTSLSTLYVPKRRKNFVARNLFLLASDCRLETAERKAEELFAEALCAQIPVEVMEECVAFSKPELARLEFLAEHGIITHFAIDTHIRFRLAVLAHFQVLLEVVKRHTPREHDSAVPMVSSAIH